MERSDQIPWWGTLDCRNKHLNDYRNKVYCSNLHVSKNARLNAAFSHRFFQTLDAEISSLACLLLACFYSNVSYFRFQQHEPYIYKPTDEEIKEKRLVLKKKLKLNL